MELVILLACGIAGLGIARIVIAAGRNLGWL